ARASAGARSWAASRPSRRGRKGVRSSSMRLLAALALARGFVFVLVVLVVLELLVEVVVELVLVEIVVLVLILARQRGQRQREIGHLHGHPGRVGALLGGAGLGLLVVLGGEDGVGDRHVEVERHPA